MLSGQLTDLIKSVFFDRNIVIIVHIVDADYIDRRMTAQQFQYQISSDKTGSAGDKNCLVIQKYIRFFQKFNSP